MFHVNCYLKATSNILIYCLLQFISDIKSTISLIFTICILVSTPQHIQSSIAQTLQPGESALCQPDTLQNAMSLALFDDDDNITTTTALAQTSTENPGILETMVGQDIMEAAGSSQGAASSSSCILEAVNSAGEIVFSLPPPLSSSSTTSQVFNTIGYENNDRE